MNGPNLAQCRQRFTTAANPLLKTGFHLMQTRAYDSTSVKRLLKNIRIYASAYRKRVSVNTDVRIYGG